MFLACIAATIWSLSACFTRGSFAPCPISSGFTIRSAWVKGERSFSQALPASVSGSPIRAISCLRNASQ